MRLHAGDGAVVPANAEHARHHADGFVVVFQHRALLDVGLEVGTDRMVAGLLGADIADTLQFASDRLALGIDACISVLQREGLGENARAHHHRHEARAFLVGPEGNLDRRLGLYAVVVERAHDLQPGQHTVVAIELAAGRLCVDVAAGDDRWQCVVAAGAAHEAVADLVDGHRHAGLARPACHQVATLPVQVGQRQATHAPLGRGTNLSQLHQRIPQAGAVDAKLVDGRSGKQFSGHEIGPG